MTITRNNSKAAIVIMALVVLTSLAVLAQAKTKLTLEQRVTAALRADRRLNGAQCYTVSPGVIVLDGTVFDQQSRALAETTARKVHGVKQVVNNLLTKSGQWQEQQARINDTLALNGFQDLSVRVVGNTAYLSGTVTGQSEQQRALRVISSISSLEVVNVSRVLPGKAF